MLHEVIPREQAPGQEGKAMNLDLTPLQMIIWVLAAAAIVGIVLMMAWASW